MVQVALSFLTQDFLSCVEPMHSALSRWRKHRLEFSQSAVIAATAIQLEVSRVEIVAELQIVAMFILEMYHAVEALGSRNREARMISAEALVRLNTFALVHFGARVVQENRLTIILDQDRIDRGGASHGPLSMIHAMTGLPVRRARQACVARV